MVHRFSTLPSKILTACFANIIMLKTPKTWLSTKSTIANCLTQDLTMIAMPWSTSKQVNKSIKQKGEPRHRASLILSTHFQQRIKKKAPIIKDRLLNRLVQYRGSLGNKKFRHNLISSVRVTKMDHRNKDKTQN